MDRDLDIAVLFPDDSQSWHDSEARFRDRLGSHRLRFAYGLDDEAIIPAVRDAEVALSFRLFERQVQAARKLRWIQGFGAGVESFLALDSLPADIILTNARGIHGDSVAEAAIAMMFALARGIPRAVAQHQAHQWLPYDSVLLAEKTVGIIGTGAIAEGLARKCLGLGMVVEGVSGTVRPIAGFARVHARDDLVNVVGRFDFIVLLAPLSPETNGMINAAIFGAMRPGTMLVNVGRGGLIDEAALVEALRDGPLRSAALDTVIGEPVGPDHGLWDVPNLFITPHNAGRHDRYVDDVLDIFMPNLDAYLRGEIKSMRNFIERSRKNG